MKVKYLFFVLLFLLAISNSFSQSSSSSGIVGGLSTTFISRAGNYEVGKQYDMALGYFSGYQRQFSLANCDFTGEAILAYNRIKYHNDLIAADEASSPLGLLELVDRNLNLILGVLYNYEVKKLKLGVGVQLEENIYTETVGKSSFISVKAKGLNNRRLDVNIPLEASYSIGKTDVLLRYERGLVNRLNSNQGEIKEFKNTIRLGAKWFFN